MSRFKLLIFLSSWLSLVNVFPCTTEGLPQTEKDAFASSKEFEVDPTVMNLVNGAIQEALTTVDLHMELSSNKHLSGGNGLQDKYQSIFGVNSSHTYCKFTVLSEKIGFASNIYIRAYEILTRRFYLPKRMVLKQLSGRLPGVCHRKVKEACDPKNKFRTIDGTCNNIQNPLWGASYMPFSRVIPAQYSDGFNAPRGGWADSLLPNSRLVSARIHHDLINPDSSITNMVPQVGQFLDHDLTLTPEEDHRCCSGIRDVDCWPIQIFSDDPFYSTLKKPQRCMDFTRSTPYCFPGHSGVREQFNILTAFVDASQVYGSEGERGRQLREFVGGRLKGHHEHGNMMPEVERVREVTGEEIEFMGHFFGGDERVNEMPALTVMHTLLFREHNRLAREIQEVRPNWSDERIFQEARRLLIAQWQNVIYGEYLPIILGEHVMDRFGLTLTHNVYSKYDPREDPTIFNSFATAAYRFGHTLINGLVRLMMGLDSMGSYRVKDNFFDPSVVLQHNGSGYDWILGGLMTQNAQTYDPFVTEDLGNFVLKKKGDDFGADLLARNIQRGREHGIPAYGAFRETCGLVPLQPTWDQIPPEIRPESWHVLRQLYALPQDIDLFTGGLVEFPIRGGISGPTFNCLKARQFARLKHGDRFFFTHGEQAGSFPPVQLEALRRVTLGDIICRNSNLTMTTWNVFRVPGIDNPWLFCNDPQRAYLKVDLFLS